MLEFKTNGFAVRRLQCIHDEVAMLQSLRPILRRTWAISSTWRTTEEEKSFIAKELSVGPNPFNNSVHISSSEMVSAVLTDVLGKHILSARGSSEELNKQLDNIASSLASGAYVLNVAEGTKSYKTFKVTKQ